MSQAIDPKAVEKLRRAIRAVVAALQVSAEPAPLEAALTSLLRQVEGVPARRRGQRAFVIPGDVQALIRERVRADGLAVTARALGVSPPTITRALATGGASFLSLARISRGLGVEFDFTDDVVTIQHEADVVGVDAATADEVWAIAEARAAIHGIQDRAGIIAAAGSPTLSALYAWATRPLDILGGAE